jgi:hypothetical protein
MTKVKMELECLKELLKREPIVKIVEELPNKETADLNYIYIIPKEGEGKDKKAYVLRPDRSGFDTIDLTPQVVSVLGEGYITVEKETLNENGDVTFTVKTSETFNNLLKEIESKNKEQDAILTDVTNRVVALENRTDKDTIYDDTELKGRVKALEDKPEPPHEANLFYAKGDIVGIGTETDIRITRDELVNADTIKVGDTVVDHYWDDKVFNTGMFKVVSIDGDNIVLNGVNNINYKHPKQELTLEGNKLSISEGNSVTIPSGNAYDDSDLKEQVNDLGSSVASALHDISEIRVNNESRLSALESREDKDKQTLSLDGTTLSISNGNSVELTPSKPTGVTSNSEGVTITSGETEDDITYNINIDNALDNCYENAKAYTDTKLSALESKEDNDKQTLSLEGRELSISNGNSVILPPTIYKETVSYNESTINKFKLKVKMVREDPLHVSFTCKPDYTHIRTNIDFYVGQSRYEYFMRRGDFIINVQGLQNEFHLYIYSMTDIKDIFVDLMSYSDISVELIPDEGIEGIPDYTTANNRIRGID